MSWLDVAERRDPAYRGALDWYCPGSCPDGTPLEEDSGGMRCTQCSTWYSWAQLSQQE